MHHNTHAAQTPSPTATQRPVPTGGGDGPRFLVLCEPSIKSIHWFFNLVISIPHRIGARNISRLRKYKGRMDLELELVECGLEGGAEEESSAGLGM